MLVRKKGAEKKLGRKETQKKWKKREESGRRRESGECLERGFAMMEGGLLLGEFKWSYGCV